MAMSSILQGGAGHDTLETDATSCPAVNVGETERMASTIGGGTLIAVGLWRGGFGGLAAALLGAGLIHRGITGHCKLYDALGANTLEEPEGEGGVANGLGVHVVESVAIQKPPGEVYRFYRDYDNLPRFMRSIASVTADPADPARSHWVAVTPVGTTLEWDSVLIADEPDRLIAWKSLPGSDVDSAGSIHFDAAPGGRGTEVRIEQKVNPPGGKLAVLAARVFGADPATQTREDLRRLKQLLEAGEIPTTAGQPTGRRI